MMTYRPLNEDEIPVAADIQSRAFRTQPERYVTRYREGGRFDWRAVRLLENSQGQPVAALTLFKRTMSLHGGELTAGLVASVGVPPEQRRRGYAHELMQGLLNELHQQHVPISLLYPFSVAFYRRLGYDVAALNWFFDLEPRTLPDFRERLNVRRATVEDDAAIRACYERARRFPRHNGWLSRHDYDWQKRVSQSDWETVVYDDGGALEGYMTFTLSFDQRTATNTAKIVEWVSATERAWRGLCGFLTALGEQAHTMTYNAPQDSPLLFALREPYSALGGNAEFVFHQAARLTTGFMLRIVNLPAALCARRYPREITANLLLRVHDEQLPANSRVLHLHIANGEGRCTVAEDVASDELPALVETDIAAFGQIFVGLLPADQARTIGRLQADDATCTLLTSAFAAAPLFMHQPDWF